MLNRDAAKPVVVAGVYHDLVKRQSTVALTWDGVADKRLVLEVPFGCSLSGIQQEAEKALREFASDIAKAPMKTVD